MSDRSRDGLLFTDVFSKPATVLFDAEGITSDGGGVLLGALDHGLGLTAALCACLEDRRQSTKVRFSLLELVRQRVMGIALGYADGNDANHLREDPIAKVLCGRDAHGEPLATQPTISRFENAFTAREVVAFSRKFEEVSIGAIRRRHGKRPKLITIDVDPTVDPTHGQQQLTFFNGHYDTWCYLPMLAFVSVDGSDQYLVSARLRPGNAPASRCAVPTIRRLVEQLRLKFPGVTIRVRLDGGYATPGVLLALEDLRVQYIVAMAKNAVLKRKAESLMEHARAEAARTNETATVFGEIHYAATTWPCERRLVVKAEVVAHPGRKLKDNPRFVITNLRHSPENAYAIYCGRGDPENRLKELKNDLEMDRTSCSAFVANQLRVLLTATAYLLYQELRWRLRRTELKTAQVGTLRERLMKIGARVVASVRRLALHCPTTYPWAHLWRAAALAVGAVGT